MTMTGKAVIEETAADWNERFDSSGWQQAGGNTQSLMFAVAIIDVLRQHESTIPLMNQLAHVERDGDSVSGFNISLHDYGCAEGDGTAFLQTIFPLCRVIGYDWSTSAVERAQARWPSVEFRQGDITNAEPATIIYTSHVMEHLPDPEATMRDLLQKCWLLIVCVPQGLSAAHIGGIPVNEWLSKFDAFTTSTLRTVRRWDLTQEVVMLETSLLYTFRGELEA